MTVATVSCEYPALAVKKEETIEDDNEKEFRKVDLKKYIEHNLARKHLVSNKSSEANKNDTMEQ